MIVLPQSKEHEKANNIVMDYIMKMISKMGFEETRKYYFGEGDLTDAPQEVVDAYPLFMEYMKYMEEEERAFGYID